MFDEYGKEWMIGADHATSSRISDGVRGVLCDARRGRDGRGGARLARRFHKFRRSGEAGQLRPLD